MIQNIVASGSTYRIYDQSVQVYDRLPSNTYKVQFSPLSGFSLQMVNDLVAGTERVYGTINSRVRKVLNTYQSIDRSLGVLASGDKGMGKTVLLRTLASAARKELNLPVVIVDTSYDGLAGFLDSLGECVIVFDEFEKTFRTYPDDEQAPFLGLFDGMSAVKRMYVVTINDIDNINNYLVNRPGRFHYHFRFNYPGPDSIAEYLTDQGVDQSQIGKVVGFAQQVRINYDHLRSIALELRHGGQFEDIIGDLNIKRHEVSHYNITLVFAKRTLKGTICLNLGGSGSQPFAIHAEPFGVYGSINPRRLMTTNEGIHVPLDALSIDFDEFGKDNFGDLQGCMLEIDHSAGRIDF